jgi:hypothetical protein
MTQKATTKDELLLIKLYHLAEKAGDFFQEIDRYVLGRAIGQNDRGVNTIIRHLAQANFVKKGDGDTIYLTKNGIALVEQLLSEK